MVDQREFANEQMPGAEGGAFVLESTNTQSLNIQSSRAESSGGVVIAPNADDSQTRDQSEKPALHLATQTENGAGDESIMADSGGVGFIGPESNLVGANPLAALDAYAAVDLRGQGWIRCADGTRIRDNGHSIYIPGRKFTPAQMDMVIQLSAAKGWSTLYAYEPGGKKLHGEVTQLLAAAAAKSGHSIQCCMDPKAAGRLRHHFHAAECAIYDQEMIRRQQAAPASSPAPTQSSTQSPASAQPQATPRP